MITEITDTSVIFTDSLNNNTRYFWTVMAVDRDSFITVKDTFSFFVHIPTGVAQSESLQLPTEFALSQNYPNPFNAVTTIKYQLPEDCHITLKAFNAMGQEVITLVNKEQKAGHYSVNWNARQVALGLYFCWIKTDEFSSLFRYDWKAKLFRAKRFTP